MTLMLKECPVMEGRGALLAHETTRMPLLIEGGDVVLSDGSVAAPALRGKLLEVAHLAVGRCAFLMESLLA